MRRKITKSGLAAFAIFLGMTAQGQGYIAGDFHQHTTYTDGSYTIGKMMDESNRFGLDWWANSEHGGGFSKWGIVSGLDLGTSVEWKNSGVTLKGSANGNNMWRWQTLTEYSFRDIQLYRKVYPTKTIFQGYEMNVPGHEHASMCIIGNQFKDNADVNALATFEYLFDANDRDDSQPLGITEAKNMTNNHKKAVDAATWLQKNYKTQSWLIPAHPERYRYNGNTGWNIEHLRDMNNAAPDVFFGFESMAGHQMSSNRGEYGPNRPSYTNPADQGATTYGGCGWMSAKVGGLWDAMLSEGRRFWLFSNSDAHNNEVGAGDFFPGEYQRTYTYVKDKKDPQNIVDGLRSGNSYVVNGDLIDSLYFSVGNATMGGTYNAATSEVTVTIRLRDPQGENYNRYSEYKNPVLDHVDLIMGEVNNPIEAPATIPTDGKSGYSDAYKCDSVSTTKVVARFAKNAASSDPNGVVTTAWVEKEDGWREMSITLPINRSSYFRLRGTNHGLGVEGETDACGNPLLDKAGENTATIAFSDLWFYSNPVFVKLSGVDHDLVKQAEALNAADYATPAWTNLLIAKNRVKENCSSDNLAMLKEMMETLPTKDTPYGINATINGDPTTRMAFAWFTNSGVKGGKVQIVAKANASDVDFASPLKEIEATSGEVKDLVYLKSSNTIGGKQVATLSGLTNGSKQNYTSNKVIATGLTPNTTYSYRVGGVNGVWSDIATFKTGKSGKEPFSFIYVTDTQSNTDEMFDISAKTIRAAQKKTPDAQFLMITGDLIETSGSTNSEWEWEQWFSSMQNSWNQLPIVPTIGNHDSSPNSNYFHHFNTDTTYNSKSGVVKSTMNGTNYAFVQGDALIMMLDYESYKTANYLTSLADWMRSVVAANADLKWRIACFHKAMYTGSRSHQSDSDGKLVREAMAPVFDELKIDLAIQGHDHIYEVIGPVNNKALVDGAVSKVTEVDGGLRENMSGKEGGIFNTYNGTLYFLNNSAGRKKYEPRTETQMEEAKSSHGVNEYWGLFTGKFGQTGEPTFSCVDVTKDTISIVTYTVNDLGEASLFDRFSVVKDKETGNKITQTDGVSIYMSGSSIVVSGTTPEAIEVYNQTGVLCESVQNQSSVSTRNLETGVFLVRATKGKDSYFSKVVIKK